MRHLTSRSVRALAVATLCAAATVGTASAGPADLDLAAPVTDADPALVAPPLREPLTRERFYFVMTDRFENAEPGNDTGGYEIPPGTPPDDERPVPG